MSEAEQGTEDWKRERLGKATASRIADVVAKTKSGWGASRDNYMAELITERVTGIQYPSFTSAAMKWGTEKEPEARAAYAFRMSKPVQKVGFIDHPTIPMSGASADGLVESDGGVEFKCPETKAHLETLLDPEVKGRYLTQIQWNMACRPERKWWDYVSFDPRVPEKMTLRIIRVPRDQAMIKDLEANVIQFLAEVAAKVKQLEKIYGKLEVL